MSNSQREAMPNGQGAAARADELIRRLVLEGFYPPGARISDLKLSQQLGVGRMHVRESFQRLAKDGVLTTIPNRGTFVTSLDSGQVAELLEVREAIEVEAVRLAAQRATPKDLSPLRELIEVSRLALVRHGGAYPMDLDFHEGLVALAGNKRLATISHEINTLLRLARARAGTKLKRWHESIQEHSDILSAIDSRDFKKAESVMRHHLAMSRRALHPEVSAGTASADSGPASSSNAPDA